VNDPHVLFGSVFLLGDEFSQPAEEKRRYRAFFLFGKNGAQVTTL
jgi:hypothetical protein